MKRSFLLVAAVVIAAALTACGASEGEVVSTTVTAATYVVVEEPQTPANITPTVGPLTVEVPTTEVPTPTTSLYALSSQEQQLLAEITVDPRESGDLVLEDNARYQLVYLISNREFVAIVRQVPYDDVKREIENWFLSQGFSQESLCSIRLSFAPAKALEEQGYQYDPQDVVPTGCSVQVSS